MPLAGIELLSEELTDYLKGKDKDHRIELTRQYAKNLILRRLWLKGEDYKGRKIVSKDKKRFGVYSYDYGKWKKKVGGRISTFNLRVTGFFYKNSVLPDNSDTLKPPAELMEMERSPHYPYKSMATLSEGEYIKAEAFYADPIFKVFKKAFRGKIPGSLRKFYMEGGE